MTRYREIFRKSATNTAAITSNSSWVGMYRVRMTDNEMESYGACNTLSISNDSNYEAQVRFGLGIETGAPFLRLKANSIKNVNVEDGYNFYGFDVMDKDATTDIPIGGISYRMGRTIDIDDPEMIDLPYVQAISASRNARKVA